MCWCAVKKLLTHSLTHSLLPKPRLLLLCWYSSGDVLGTFCLGTFWPTDLGTFWSYTRGRFGLVTFWLDTFPLIWYLHSLARLTRGSHCCSSQITADCVQPTRCLKVASQSQASTHLRSQITHSRIRSSQITRALFSFYPNRYIRPSSWTLTRLRNNLAERTVLLILSSLDLKNTANILYVFTQKFYFLLLFTHNKEYCNKEYCILLKIGPVCFIRWWAILKI